MIDQKATKEEVAKFIIKYWGSGKIATRGRIVDATSLPRIIIRNKEGKITALAVYRIDRNKNLCKLIAMATDVLGKGIGSALLLKVEEKAKKERCEKIWLITTNDNLEAIAFYNKKGYRLAAVHQDSVKALRKLKPEIPLMGQHGLPIKDEWEFEKSL